jgi:sodium/potassium-transporting ATPase subunit alpha
MYSAFQVGQRSILPQPGRTNNLRFLFVQSNNDDDATATFSVEAPGMREMVDIAALNSRVKFDKTDIPFDQRTILGDATETGLTRFAGRSLGSGYDAHQKNFPKVFEGTSLPPFEQTPTHLASK